MKQNILLLGVVIIFAAFACIDAFAQNKPTRNDSIVTTVRLNGLQTKKDKLQKEIKVQDAKRDRQMTGVTPETLEAMNDRQDSVCLALRSELVNVILEIKEVSPDVSSPILIRQYRELVNKTDSTRRRAD